jgi:hypothetical protein
MEWNIQNGGNGNDNGMTFGCYPQGGMYKLQTQVSNHGPNGDMGMGIAQGGYSRNNQGVAMNPNDQSGGGRMDFPPPDDLGAIRGGIPMNHLRKYTGLKSDSFQKYRMNPVPGGGLPSGYTDANYPNDPGVSDQQGQQQRQSVQQLQRQQQQQMTQNQEEIQRHTNAVGTAMHSISPNMDMNNSLMAQTRQSAPSNISTVRYAPQHRSSSLPQGGLHNPQLQARMMTNNSQGKNGNMYNNQQLQQNAQQGMHGFSIDNIVNRNPLEPSAGYLSRMQQKNLNHMLEQEDTLRRQREKKELARTAEIEAIEAKNKAELAISHAAAMPNHLMLHSTGKEIADASAIEPEGDDDDFDEDVDEEGQDGNKKARLSRQQNVHSLIPSLYDLGGKSMNIKEEMPIVNAPIYTHSIQESTEVKAKEKNREHAKNTRMRKKSYIESLKDQVKEMSESREQLDQTRRMALLNKANLVDSRKKVISDFLICRTYGELDPIIWSKLLDKNFEMALPVTPYRSFPPTEVSEGRRILRGIPAIIADTASLAVLFKTVGTPSNDGFFCRAQFYSLNEETISSGDRIMCKWYMCTENASERGAETELTKQGMLVAHFAPAPSNVLLRLEVNFDVMNFMQQLRRANGALEFQVVPNMFRVAVDMAHVADIRMLVHYSKEKPEQMLIHTVSKKWCETFGYSVEDIKDKTEAILHGGETDQFLLQQMMVELDCCRPACGFVTYYTKKGDKLVTRKEFYPIFTEGVCTHYLAVISIVENPVPAPLLVVQNSKANSANPVMNAAQRSSSSASNSSSTSSHGHTSNSNSSSDENATNDLDNMANSSGCSENVTASSPFASSSTSIQESEAMRKDDMNVEGDK